MYRTSLLSDLIEAVPSVRSQVFFKSSLVALCHALEDLVLSGTGKPILFANFQKERYYRQEAHRYHRLSDIAAEVYVLATPETDFHQEDVPFTAVALDPDDPLTNEWHLIIIDEAYCACLICRERVLPADSDTMRQFEGYWSFEPLSSIAAAQCLIQKIQTYRPDLKAHLDAMLETLAIRLTKPAPTAVIPSWQTPFADRLMLYLQAGQYKLQRAYRRQEQQARKESLIHEITTAIRQSLDPESIYTIAVQAVGEALAADRCILYRCSETQMQVTLNYEYRHEAVPSIVGQTWPVHRNPLLGAAMRQGEPVQQRGAPGAIASLWKQWQICAWLAVPIMYQGRVLGMLELHHRDCSLEAWPAVDVELVQAVALQLGVALIQADAYENVTRLNHELAELDQAKTNLIAITGHELRTPLSTIQVCLESLATEPDMDLAIRQIMLDTALQDAARLRQVVEDLLMLTRLESGRVEWHPELMPATECVDLAVSSLRSQTLLPSISIDISAQLPMLEVDGEWLVQVLRKLLDNACKFTPTQGEITITAVLETLPVRAVRFTVADTGRGIEPDRLPRIFERFYQEEGSLRRTAGGTGLGLAICQQIIQAMGGRIWAESGGRDQGSAFHFTVPIAKRPSLAA